MSLAGWRGFLAGIWLVVTCSNGSYINLFKARCKMPLLCLSRSRMIVPFLLTDFQAYLMNCSTSSLSFLLYQFIANTGQ
jgi:hypothetical protein